MPVRLRRALFVIALLLLPSLQTTAHEVPSELRVDVYLKPEGNVVHVLLRVPLSGLLGTDMPKEGLGYLSLANIDPALQRTAQQLAGDLEIFENDRDVGAPRIVATRISLPYDTSFRSYEQAAAHVTGPRLPVETQVYWTQGNFDAWLDYPIRSVDSSFSLHSDLMILAPKVTTALRFVNSGGEVQSFEFLGDPERIRLDPAWYQVIPRFAQAGFLDAVRRIDLWLFAACVLIPWRRAADVLPAIAAFATAIVVATLVMTYGPDASGDWLPPLIDVACAAVLLYLALENIAAPRRSRRWSAAVALGLPLGGAFAIAMRPIAQFAVGHVLVSVVALNAGILGATAAALLIAFAVLALVYRLTAGWRWRAVILSAIAAHYAWNALIERVHQLDGIQWPLPTPENLVNATSWALVLVAAAGCLWLVSGVRSQPVTR